MEPEPTEQAEEISADAAAGMSDPFAVDLFAAGRAQAPGPAARGASRPEDFLRYAPGRPWHAALPKVSSDEARSSAMLAALPPSLAGDAREALALTLARLAGVEPHVVSLEAVALREAAASELDASLDSERRARAFWTLRVEPDGAPLALLLDTDFASAVVDRLLGGAGASPAPLRGLSATERAVVEFACLSAVHELNVLAGEPLFRLESGTDDPPSLTAARRADPAGEPGVAGVEGRALILTVRVELSSTIGVARLVFGEAALAALNASANPLLARAARGSGRTDARLAAYRRFVSEVQLRLLVGETHLDARDVADVERGDIVIVASTAHGWATGRPAGRLTLTAGGGRGVSITGRVAAPSSRRDDGQEGGDSAAGNTTALIIESVERGGADGAERISMEDEGHMEGAAAGAAALEGLLLTVHVELPARRISLEELSRLRAGQILELGCRPTDPVELVADGRRIAAGELVDIDGRLGVRVTRLLA